MLWKIFAIISAIVLADGIFRFDPKDWIDVAAIPVELIAVTGIVIYAFNINYGRSSYWMGFAWFYAAFAVFELYVGVSRSAAQKLSIPIIIGGTIIAAAYLFINWIALHRLGKQRRFLPSTV
jgi:predicted membrane protein